MRQKHSKKPEDLDKRLADMVTAGFSAAEMAASLGVTRPTVTSWLHEHGYVAVNMWTRPRRRAA